ncbi:MAG: pantetheine-phosphate adenylyltransferase [Candidatus Omnitrophica bacterium]|nr:pantetheine-phosphate adenylyltransferase [Candidatus Omnitrophota bacterium]
MQTDKDNIAIYPGTFDPVTYGHLDIMTRATRIFDKVIIAVAQNVPKHPLFNDQERIEMLKEVTADNANIEIKLFKGLVIDFAHQEGVNVLIRGLRMISDFEYEFQMALTNRRLASDIETVFLMPSEGCSFLSSTLIREAATLGGDITSFVPETVAKKLLEKLQRV